MSDKTLSRVRYFDTQFLRPQDFTDEQAYHLTMRRRHNIGGHLWGIVHGLEIEVETATGGGRSTLTVEPGVAIDAFGRELILSERVPLSPTAFDDKGSESLDVWLLYYLRKADRADECYAVGVPAEDAFYRWREEPQVWLRKHQSDLDPRTEPPQVPDNLLELDPSRPPPGEEEDWPVFLGTVIRDLSDPANPTYSVDGRDRPYAGLVGAEVASPRCRQMRVEIGGDEGAGAGTTPPIFAVVAPDSQTVFEIDGSGHARIEGELTVKGDLRIRDGALDFTRLLDKQSENRPWCIYRTREVEDEKEIQVLRVEIVPNGKAVIGIWSPESGKFEACLEVRKDTGLAAPTVKVHGDLVVDGEARRLDGTPLEVTRPRALSPEARRFRTAAVSSGVAGSPVLRFPETTLGLKVSPPSNFTVPQVLAEVLARDPEAVRAFAQRVVAQGGDAARALRDELAKAPSQGGDAVEPEETAGEDEGKGGE